MNRKTAAAHIPIGLPQHIRVQDQAVWRAWMESRNVSTVNTKRTYTRQLCGFYEYNKKPIRETEDVDIDSYEQYRRESGKSAATIKREAATIKSYWAFAREQEASKL